MEHIGSASTVASNSSPGVADPRTSGIDILFQEFARLTGIATYTPYLSRGFSQQRAAQTNFAWLRVLQPRSLSDRPSSLAIRQVALRENLMPVYYRDVSWFYLRYGGLPPRL